MGFTRTRSGPSLQTRANQINRQSAKVTRAVFALAQKAVDDNTPRDTGLLRRWLRQGEVTAFRASIGPLAGTRYNVAAPPHTIAQFVAYYQMFFHRRPGRPAGVMSWYTLSGAQKKLLRNWRLQGAPGVGGPYPPPVYFGAVDKGLVPGQGSNANVGFTDRIIAQIKANIPQAIRDAMN